MGYIRKCHDCDCEITIDNRVEVRTPMKAYVCKSCATEYGTCGWCGNKVPSEELGWYGNILCCDKCSAKNEKDMNGCLSRHERIKLNL